MPGRASRRTFRGDRRAGQALPDGWANDDIDRLLKVARRFEDLLDERRQWGLGVDPTFTDPPPAPTIRTREDIQELLDAGRLDADGYLVSVRGFAHRHEQQGRYAPTPLREQLVRPTDDRDSHLSALTRSPAALPLLLAMHTLPNTLDRFTDAQWAEMLGHAEPDDAERRQVLRARARLHEVGLLTTHKDRTVLADERKSSRPYKPPTASPGRGFWLRVPWTITTHGWLAVLDQKALAALLVLLSASPGQHIEDDQRLHDHAPANYPTIELGRATRSRQFDLGDTAFYDGVRTLREWGLVNVQLVEDPRRPDGMARSFYRLNGEMMLRTPLHTTSPIAVTHPRDYLDELRSLDWLPS